MRNAKRIVVRCRQVLLIGVLTLLPGNAFPQGVLPAPQGNAVQQALDDYQHHDFEKTRAELEANLKLQPKDPASHELLGVILDLQGKPADARHHFEEALSLSPNNSAYRTNLVSFYLKSNLIPEARKAIQPLLGPMAGADVDEMMGYICVKERQERDAVSDFRMALKLEPDRIESWYWLGFADQSLGEFEDALASYRQVLRINPQHFRAHLQMGKIYLTQGSWSQAVDHLTSASRIRPDYAATYRYLSEAQMSLGKPELARSWALRAVQLDPQDARAHYELGLALARLGRNQEAASQFQIVDRLRAASPQSMQGAENEEKYQDR